MSFHYGFSCSAGSEAKALSCVARVTSNNSPVAQMFRGTPPNRRSRSTISAWARVGQWIRRADSNSSSDHEGKYRKQPARPQRRNRRTVGVEVRYGTGRRQRDSLHHCQSYRPCQCKSAKTIRYCCESHCPRAFPVRVGLCCARQTCPCNRCC